MHPSSSLGKQNSCWLVKLSRDESDADRVSSYGCASLFGVMCTNPPPRSLRELPSWDSVAETPDLTSGGCKRHDLLAGDQTCSMEPHIGAPQRRWRCSNRSFYDWDPPVTGSVLALRGGQGSVWDWAGRWTMPRPCQGEQNFVHEMVPFDKLVQKVCIHGP